MKIYVASSWRNTLQPSIVEVLRAEGHEVYDFKNPAPGNNGFHWSEIDTDWKDWDPFEFRAGLANPIADIGFHSDMKALEECDACVLVLPCGRSAHLELGYAVGAKKKTVVFYPTSIPRQEPELMYKMCDSLCVTVDELLKALR